MQLPGRNGSSADYEYGFNGMRKDNEIKGDNNSYDFGARIYDPRVARFLTEDAFSTQFSYQSPYIFASNTPIFGIDINGDSLYILAYTPGDEMFEAGALTRQNDIENSPGFDPTRDKVVIIAAPDMGELESQVETAVATYSGVYGETVEFGLWSHSGQYDGPVGDTWTSGDHSIFLTQMSDQGWGEIDFNWSKSGQTRAVFYGCNTALPGGWVSRISKLDNFKDVYVAGQSNSSYPSVYVDIRKYKGEYGLDDDDDFVWEHEGKTYYVRTYMVSGKGKSSDWNGNEQGDAYKMNVYKNGNFITSMYQPGTSSDSEKKGKSAGSSSEKSGKLKSSTR